jgi:hypothetical protein
MNTIEFTNCIWCDQPVDERAVPVDEETTLGRVFGHVCRACDRDTFNNKTQEK